MNRTRTRGTARIIAILAALAVAGALAIVALVGLRSPDAYAGCDRYNMAIAAIDGEISSGGNTGDLETERTHLADYRQQAKDDGCTEGAQSSASETEQTTAQSTEAPATTASPAPEPAQDSSSASADPAAVADDSWTPRYFVLENDPATPRNFGPAVDPATALQEFRPRMEADPALLCADGLRILAGGNFDVVDEDSNGSSPYRECMNNVLSSKSARDAFLDQVFAQIDMEQTRVETREPQEVETAFMVYDDETKRVYTMRTSVTRTSEYHVLDVVTKDGSHIPFRLECGFQWDSGVELESSQPEEAAAPAQPAPQESGPEQTAPECVNGGGRDENGKCVPPETPGTHETTVTSGTTSTVVTTSPPGSTTSTTSSTTSTTTTETTTSLESKTGMNSAAVTTGSESHSVDETADGGSVSNGRQDDPAGDAEEAASSAAASNASQSAAASSSAAQADTDSGGGSDSHGQASVTATAGAPTGAAGENTGGDVWDTTG